MSEENIDEICYICGIATILNVDGVCCHCYESMTTYKKKPIPQKLRWAVFERDNFTCQSCGTRSNLAVDHIRPELLGGTIGLENLQTLCKSCNSVKGSKLK